MFIQILFLNQKPLSNGFMTDSFLHKHQASLDRQREEDEINWLFPKDDEEEVEDEDFPYEDYEPSDYEMMSNFGTKWHDGL